MNLIGKAMSKQYESMEDLVEDLVNYKVTIRMRIAWFFKNIHRKARTIVRTPKWWYQRIARGYSDKDMWNADMYIAKILAGTLRWYIKNSQGLPTAYGTPPDYTDLARASILRDTDYEYFASIFYEYYKNGPSFNDAWKKEFGGVSEEEYNQAMDWLKKHLTELWD